MPPESDREQKRNLAYLVVLAGVSAGEMFKLQKDKTVVGRGPAVGVRLNDEGVSREHCAFVREGDKMVVEDMGSTNGTFCNGIKVDRRELVDGDKIMVGSSTILKFTYHDYLDEVFQRQMYESALRDGLTKVFNKKYFTDYLEKEFAFAARHGGPLALIFLDIDYFKKINDTHGHPAGDFVLAELSQMMATLLRTEDVLARFGGEEFTILCRGSDLSGAKIVAERVRKAVEGASSARGKASGHHQPGGRGDSGERHHRAIAFRPPPTSAVRGEAQRRRLRAGSERRRRARKGPFRPGPDLRRSAQRSRGHASRRHRQRRSGGADDRRDNAPDQARAAGERGGRFRAPRVPLRRRGAAEANPAATAWSGRCRAINPRRRVGATFRIRRTSATGRAARSPRLPSPA